MRAERGTQYLLTKAGIFLAQVLLLLTFFVSAGCKSSGHLATVEQLDQPPDIRIHHHTVSKGDTLYSIAWRYSIDYRTLAGINNIVAPYTIHVGQKLNLGTGSPSRGGGVVSDSAGTQVYAVPDSREGVSEVRVVDRPETVKPVTAPIMAKPAENVEPVVEPVVKPATTLPPAARGKWLWPSRGRVISSFSVADPLRKGIDLDGKLGESVSAAAGGNVVYAGSGLAGYGQLVIIKHDDQFLSAYGHNSKLLVREGETVKAGQKIAEIGSSGTDRDKLHFEIRYEGKPVDPLLYLPRR